MGTITFEESAHVDSVARFKAITDDMVRTYEEKNHDYGDSYTRSVEELGVISGFVPIFHKFHRLQNLITNNETAKVDESLQDTLMDMANYCIMLRMVLGNNQD